jgi:hypothetical protein
METSTACSWEENSEKPVGRKKKRKKKHIPIKKRVKMHAGNTSRNSCNFSLILKFNNIKKLSEVYSNLN